MELDVNNLISNAAFPIAVCWFLLTKFSKLIESLQKSIDNNTMAIEILKEKIGIKKEDTN